MDWSLPKIIAGFVATGVLLLVYVQLFILHRRKFLALWSAAWLCYVTRHILSIWLPPDFASVHLIVQAYSLLAALGAYLLLWGTLLFVDSRVKAPTWPMAAIPAGFVLAKLSQLLNLPQMIVIAPACIAVGLTYAHAGLCLLRANGLERWPRYAAGSALIYWGIGHQILITVLISPTPTSIAWGLLAGTSIEVLTAIFLLVAFYQQMHQDLLRSQQEIISRQERLEAALGHLPIAVYAFAQNGKLALWNQAAHKLTGYDASDFNSRDHGVQLMFDSQDQRIFDLDSKHLAHGVPLTLIRKNGEKRQVILHTMGSTAPLKGWPYWGAVQDITRQHLAEKELRRQLDFNNAVLHSATALTVVVNAKGRIILFNRACEIATGKSANDVVGSYAWDTLTPPEKRQPTRMFFERIDSEQFPNQGMLQWLRTDGGRISIQWFSNAIRDDQGRIEYIVTSGVDVTKQLEAQAALRRSEQFHRGLLDNMPVGMLIFDYPQRDPVYANPASHSLLDLPDSHKSHAEKLHDWASIRMGKLVPIIEDLEPGQTIMVEDVALLNRFGRPLHCDVSASVVEIEGSHKIICFLRDSGQRDETRLRIRQVAGSVAHNFNNLLMAITGNLQALGDLMQNRQADRSEMKLVDNVAKAASNGQDMVSRLEAFLVAGVRGNDDHEVLSIAEVVHTALDLVGSALTHNKCRSISADVSKDLWVRGHRGELVEVLLNLLNNAIEAAGQCGEVKIQCAVDHDMVRLDIKDNGPGIAPENLSRLFEPFFSTKDVRGKGLGLASCKGIITAHGGVIEAQSPQKGGAVFSIKLPSAEPLPQPVSKAQTNKVSSRPRAILLVEDEALVAMGAEAVLTSAGHNVIHAANVAQARVALRQSWPDVVICDQGLPDGSAWDVARAMKAAPGNGDAHTPFVVVTGWNLDSQGMVPPPDIPKPDMVIRKPVERSELLRAVDI